ncbi:MAG: GIY-YIG nuclease family protein, partial [Massilia sp.]
ERRCTVLRRLSFKPSLWSHHASFGIEDSHMDRSSYVYILASGLNGTLYIGVTSDLVKRVWQHREGLAEGFTKRYGVKMLVWYEVHADIVEAIRREKQIKKWARSWKVELIQKVNPRWLDLYPDIAS